MALYAVETHVPGKGMETTYHFAANDRDACMDANDYWHGLGYLTIALAPRLARQDESIFADYWCETASTAASDAPAINARVGAYGFPETWNDNDIDAWYAHRSRSRVGMARWRYTRYAVRRLNRETRRAFGWSL